MSRVLHALDHGDVTAAVAASAGPLLPGSDSPDVVEWRAYVEVALRTGVLGCRDPEVVRQHADAHPYDEQLQRHLLDVLAPGDPRRAGAQARWERARSS